MNAEKANPCSDLCLANWSQDCKFGKICGRPLQIPRFRKNEGGVDQFAEGYKTFGFQRRDVEANHRSTLSSFLHVYCCYKSANDTTCILMYFDLCLGIHTIQPGTSQNRNGRLLSGFLQQEKRFWLVSSTIGTLGTEMWKIVIGNIPTHESSLQIGLEGCPKKFCTPASPEGSMLKWQVDRIASTACRGKYTPSQARRTDKTVKLFETDNYVSLAVSQHQSCELNLPGPMHAGWNRKVKSDNLLPFWP